METSETQAIFGPLVPGRECGGCTACCEHIVVESDVFSKPSGVLCRHACAAGCAIHEERYPVCRAWHCLWRHIPDLPEEARPDRCGILWGYAWSEGDHRRFQTRYVHGICFQGLQTLTTPPAQTALAHFMAGDLPVWVSEPGGDMVLRHPVDPSDPDWNEGVYSPG